MNNPSISLSIKSTMIAIALLLAVFSLMKYIALLIHELKSHPETESNNNIASDAIEMRTIERVIMQHREEIVCMKNIMTTEPIDSPCRMHSR
ncbi:uncharacterized protein LOC114878018 isoform X3 [Osmia bicornis bicornis]|uniref:uncharacterized protein LOC114878018 isoform X3 n=1 Tax=Osmia bicornis bicornis TaxID=1437191 RepID=UPI001EAF3047|nr:uncharacterized protein LOC114878018 isoform X3 [Osmia bicornis bicornis]